MQVASVYCRNQQFLPSHGPVAYASTDKAVDIEHCYKIARIPTFM